MIARTLIAPSTSAGWFRPVMPFKPMFRFTEFGLVWAWALSEPKRARMMKTDAMASQRKGREAPRLQRLFKERFIACG